MPGASMRRDDDGEQSASRQRPDQTSAAGTEPSGQPTPDEPICAACGRPIGRDDIVCPHCGTSLVAG